MSSQQKRCNPARDGITDLGEDGVELACGVELTEPREGGAGARALGHAALDRGGLEEGEQALVLARELLAELPGVLTSAPAGAGGAARGRGSSR